MSYFLQIPIVDDEMKKAAGEVKEDDGRNNWAWQDLQNDLFAQRRLRSTSLRYPYEETLYPWMS